MQMARNFEESFFFILILTLCAVKGLSLGQYSPIEAPSIAQEEQGEPLVILRSSANGEGNLTSYETNEYYDPRVSCSMIALSPGQFVMFDNGTAFIKEYDRSYNASEYILNDGSLYICYDAELADQEAYEENDDVIYDPILSYTTTAGISISIVCLSIHLILFVLLPEMRTFQVCNLSSLCFSLIVAYSCFLSVDIYEISPIACNIVAVMMHYSFLASFFWSNIISFDVLKTLYSSKVVASTSYKKKYVIYSIYAWLSPLAITLTAVLFNYAGLGPSRFRPGFAEPLCWFQNREALLIFFGVPLMLILLVNMIFFLASIKVIFCMTLEASDLASRSLKKDLAVYLRLAVIMGFAWIFGIVASFTEVREFWYLFVVLTTLQGMFIFLSFTCFNRVVQKKIKWVFCKTKSKAEYDSTFTALNNI